MTSLPWPPGTRGDPRRHPLCSRFETADWSRLMLSATASQPLWDAESQNGVSFPVNHPFKIMKIIESKRFTPMIFAFFIQPAKEPTRGVFQTSFLISLDKAFPPGLCFAFLQAPRGSKAFPLLPGTAFKRSPSSQALTASHLPHKLFLQSIPGQPPQMFQESEFRDALGLSRSCRNP